MSDVFRKIMDSHCCVGGLTCRFCSDWRGKSKKKVRRIARRALKAMDRKAVA